jgi:hypothetical protein
LYKCETWYLTQRDVDILSRVFGLTRPEVAGTWRKLHSEELYNLYSLPNIVRVIKKEGYIGRTCSILGRLEISTKF